MFRQHSAKAWVLVFALAIVCIPAAYVAAQEAFISQHFFSSRCGTQRYYSRFLFAFERVEESYDEWEIGSRWAQAHGKDCPEDDWQLLWDLWDNGETRETFADWPELNRLVAKQFDLPAIVTLIHRGADPNKTDRYGRTALHWAYAADKSDAYRNELVKILIDAGAGPTTKDEDGLRPDQWRRHQQLPSPAK